MAETEEKNITLEVEEKTSTTLEYTVSMLVKRKEDDITGKIMKVSNNFPFLQNINIIFLKTPI